MTQHLLSKSDTMYTSVKLLECFFEFYSLVPNQKDWKEAKLKKRPALYYRFLQLTALCKAYGISSVDSFADGDFIPASANKYTEYHERMNFIVNMNKLLLQSRQYENLKVSDLKDNWIFLYSIAQKARAYSFDLLAEIISPTNKTFTRRELVEKYGFPDVSSAEMADGNGAPRRKIQAEMKTVNSEKTWKDFKVDAVPPAL